MIEPPTLTGFAGRITVAENTVNRGPTPLGLNVDLVRGDLLGGAELVLSGLLPEDRIIVPNLGAGPGQIGRSGDQVTFGGTVIGAVCGGGGETLRIALTDAATPQAVTALIEPLA